MNEHVKAEAKARIVTYYKSLADDKKLLLRDWLLYLRERSHGHVAGAGHR